MANRSRFVIAESRIKSFFKEQKFKVYTAEGLGAILEEKRALWNLPAYMNLPKFIEKLLTREILTSQEIIFSGYLNQKKVFIAPGASVFEVAATLINKSYLSHYSAAYLHGLTTQVPKVIYISFEQSKKAEFDGELEQAAIDSALSKPQRISGTTSVYEDYTFLIHNGMYSNRLGVFTLNDLPVTNIERTLIDIAVRPAYSGGVYSVLEIYTKAIERISINKLQATLDKLNFIYPYHQVIGFYLERAGLSERKLDVFRTKEKINDFYLTYEMPEKEYNKDWRLYYPKGM